MDKLRWTPINRRIERAYRGFMRNQGKLSSDFYNQWQYYKHEHQFRAAVRYWTAVQAGYRQADFWHFV